jgi:hypothetical protein
MIVGSAGEAPHPIGVARPAAQHDHRHVGVDARCEPVGRPHPIEKNEPAPVLEREIEHYEHRLAHLDGPQALRHAGRPTHPEAVRCEVVE